MNQSKIGWVDVEQYIGTGVITIFWFDQKLAHYYYLIDNVNWSSTHNELETSSNILSVAPFLKGGCLYKNGKGISAPKNI